MPTAATGKEKRGDIDAHKKCEMMVIRWTDKRTLLMLSPKYENEVMDVQSRYE